jgi:hypothetical protein
MKITGTGSLQSSAPIRRKGTVGRSGATSFAGELTDDSPVQGSSGLGDVGGVSTLLTVQEIGDPIAERKRAVRRGQDMLDRLDELRHGLLMGSFPAEKLDSLLATVRRQHDRVADPRLREVLREIELRAAVELAKLGRME